MAFLLPHQFKTFIGLLESLRAELASMRTSFAHQIDAIRDGQEANRQAQEKIQSRLSELRVPENEKSEARARNKKNDTVQMILTGATCGAFLAAAIYAGIAGCEWRTMNKTFELSRRPWIAIDDSEHVGVVAANSLRYVDNRSKAVVRLAYRLKNFGHSPANVVIYGELYDAKDARIFNSRYFPAISQRICTDALRKTRRPDENGQIPWTWAVIPESPMIYTIEYDGRFEDKPLDVTAEMKTSDGFTPVSMGCILYQATGEDDIHQTAFVAKISMVDVDGKPPRAGHEIPIRFSDGEVPAEKLCITEVLMIGKAT